MRLMLQGLVALVLVGMLAACGAPSAGAPAGSDNPAATASAAASGELTVFAAASLTDAFKEIGKNFAAANNNAAVSFNFAGSDKLAQQITQGAPADVFASANKKQMDVVVASGDVASDAPVTFARNRLVVLYPKDNPANLQSLRDLAKPGVKIVLANKNVPVGSYSLDFLAKASKLPEYTETYSATVLQNVVSYEENVKAVLSKVVLGEADAGIVYSSDVALDSSDNVGKIDIPDTLNTLATYPIAPTAKSAHADLAKKFVQYVLSPEGQQILAKYGFIPAEE